MEDIRLQRGQEIAQIKDSIKRIDKFSYVVKSQSNGGSYNIHATGLGWNCDRPDYIHRGVKCKHIHAVEISFALRKEVEVTRIEPIINTTNCIFCNCSSVVKFGIRHNTRGDIQKYRCNDCKHYFTINLGFERMHATPQMITSAMQLYFTGESLRNVERFLKLQGVNSSHMSVYRWIKK